MGAMVGPQVMVGPRDQAVIAGQLGRRPHDLTGVPVRCPFNYPAVIETAPVLTGGAPNPTLLYLTCPTMVVAVSRAEAAGGVRALKSAVEADVTLRDLLDRITALYRRRRIELAGGAPSAVNGDARLDAGIGGPRGPEIASCLHAYAAALLATMSGWPAHAPATGACAGMDAGARQVWDRFLPPAADCWCAGGRCSRWDLANRPDGRRAVIDVGTISVRLLVADVVDGRPCTLVRKAEVTRLGEGLRPGGPLAGGARRRTAEVVARFTAEARGYGVESLLLAGTSATREALDGREFLATLGEQHGVDVAVLSGCREAELAYAGASLDCPSESMVLLDVGGGSTELIVHAEEGTIETVSLQLGASRATDTWIKSDPPVAGEIEAIYREAAQAFEGVRHRFGAELSGRTPYPGGGSCDGTSSEGGSLEEGLLEGRPSVSLPASSRSCRLVGVAGTVTTLACLDAGLERYDADSIHLSELSLDSVRQLAARLGALTTAERAALPCVQAGRAPVIVAGAVIVQAAMETLGYNRMTVSERDLLDGLVLRGA